MEALTDMTAQNFSINIYQQKLNNCVVREKNSDTHCLDVLGAASGITVYANALHREATGRRRARRIRRAARG
ncbi:MAG: hypothetical protein EON85_15815 [Brevundimonas sp.]|nr:MAG: hypothetical protein EON85_15815 [Brevundimonas sp.]